MLDAVQLMRVLLPVMLIVNTGLVLYVFFQAGNVAIKMCR